MSKLLAKGLVLILQFFLTVFTKPLTSLLAWLGEWGFFFFARKEVTQLYVNVERVWSLPRQSAFARDFAHQCVRHQIVSALESAAEILVGNRVTFEGMPAFREELHRLETRGKGLVLITGHQGSWELVAKMAAANLGKTLHVMAKPARLDVLTQVLDILRQKSGVSVLWTGSVRVLKDMLRVLKRGEALGFVMDQKPQNRLGVHLPFMGHEAAFVGGPANLAKRTGSPVAAIFCMRVSPWRYKLYCKEVATEAGTLSEEELTKRMVGQIEDMIKLYPEQWTWNYRRWKWGDLGIT